MVTKKWWQSKTIWLNVLTILVTAITELVGAFPTGRVAAIGASVLAILNIVLRLARTTTIETPANPSTTNPSNN